MSYEGMIFMKVPSKVWRFLHKSLSFEGVKDQIAVSKTSFEGVKDQIKDTQNSFEGVKDQIEDSQNSFEGVKVWCEILIFFEGSFEWTAEGTFEGI